MVIATSNKLKFILNSLEGDQKSGKPDVGKREWQPCVSKRCQVALIIRHDQQGAGANTQ